MQNVTKVASKLHSPYLSELPAPEYYPQNGGGRVALAVEAMKRHTADAGWQIMSGLNHAGYLLCGSDLTINEQDTIKIVESTNPSTMVVQDKREWEGKTARQRGNERLKFYNIDYLKSRDDIFKLTVLKDAHQNPEYHKNSADEMGVHAWIIYYHPTIVKRVAPYIRLEHCIRTSHSIDPIHIPAFRPELSRKRCLVSGAVSIHYPLRQRVIKNHRKLGSEYYRHPGYRSTGCVTPHFLQLLSRYKISICTSSKYGYSLRKLIESSACGCRVITDLPEDDQLPIIEENLIRVPTDISIQELFQVIKQTAADYDPKRQSLIAQATQEYYDYRTVGLRLANNIEQLRLNYESKK